MINFKVYIYISILGIIPINVTVVKWAFWYKSATQLCKGNKPNLKKNVININKKAKINILSIEYDIIISFNSDKNNVPVLYI